MRKRVTLTDVARHAGVSYAAVSTVLNNGRSNSRVSASTRQRIEASAAELRYHRNAIAHGLAHGRSNAIGLVCYSFEGPLVTNPYAVGILEGVLTAASRARNTVSLMALGQNEIEEAIAFVRDGSMDGCVVIDPVAESPGVKAIASTGYPLVTIASRMEDHGLPAVDVDNKAGTRIAVEYLLSLGHTRIAHISGSGSFRHDIERMEAFCAVMKAAGISVPPEYVVTVTRDVQEPEDAVRQLLALPTPPTAIFASNDYIGVKVITTATLQGVAVPSMLSVVGFDDAPMSLLTVPRLTTIRQPMAKIGAFATELVLRQIDGVDEAPRTYIFEPELIVRESTAPAPR